MLGDEGRDEPTHDDVAEILRVARRAALAADAGWHEADEVAQLTGLKLWRAWRPAGVDDVRRRGPRTWHAYIRRTALNIHRDLIRSHRRRIDRNNRAAGGREIASVPRPGAQAMLPVSPDGVDAYLGRALVITEIRELPFKQRVVAELIFVDELSIGEVAIDLGIQPQSVRKHLRKARDELRRRLTETEPQTL